MAHSEWYRTYFNEPYGEVYADYLLGPEISKEEAHFAALALGLKAHHRVLDCPCGYGRHMDVLTHAVPDVVGIDLDADCLRRGRQWMPGWRVAQGDMRRLPLGAAAFDAVMNLFNSFGYFTESENRTVLSEFARVLRPRGKVLIDIANPGPLIEIVTDMPRTSQQVMDLRITEDWRYDEAASRLHNETCIELGGRRLHRSYDLRLYSLDELDAMLAEAGLETAAVYGEFDGADYDEEESSRLMVVGRKKEAEA